MGRCFRAVSLTRRCKQRHEKRGRNKAPSSNDIGLEFSKANWAKIKEDIFSMINQMFMERNISTQQKHGMIVCQSNQLDR